MPQIDPAHVGFHTPIGQDFVQAPLGRLGGLNVQQLQAHPPRTGLSAVFHGIGSLASRALNAITPNGVRAEQKFRADLKEASARMGDLLGELSRNPQDVDAIDRAMQRMDSAAEAVTTRSGVARDQLMRERILVHVGNMTPPQRAQLHAGLTAAAVPFGTIFEHDDALSPTARVTQTSSLTFIRDTMIERLLAPMQDSLNRALAVGERGHVAAAAGNAAGLAAARNDATDALEAMESAARNTLRADGLPDQQIDRMARSLASLALESRIAESRQSAIPTERLLTILPDETLLRMKQDNLEGMPPVCGKETERIAGLCDSAISSRCDRLERAAIDGLRTLALMTQEHAGKLTSEAPGRGNQLPDGSSPESLALLNQLAKTGSALADFRAYNARFDLRVSEKMQKQLNDLQDAPLRDLRDNMPLRHDIAGALGRASDETLSALAKSNVDMPPDVLDGIDAEFARREAAAAGAYRQTLTQGLNQLADGHIADALRTFASAQTRGDEAFVLRQRGDEAVRLHQSHAPHEFGADEIMSFRGDGLMRQAIEELPPGRLQQIAGQLTAPAMSGLIDEMSTAGTDLLVHSADPGNFDPLGRAMFDRATDLALLKEMAVATLSTRDLPALPALEQPNTRELMSDVFGFGRKELSPEGSTRFTTEVLTPLSADELTPNPPTALQGTAPNLMDQVPGIFIRDLNRATHLIDGEVLHNGTPDLQNANLVRLRDDVVHGDMEMLRVVTGFANQRSMAALMMVMREGHVDLGDGLRGHPFNGGMHSTYDMQRQPDGSVIVKFEQRFDQFTAFSPSTGLDGIATAPESTVPRNIKCNFALRFVSTPRQAGDAQEPQAGQLRIDGATRWYTVSVAEPLTYVADRLPLPSDDAP